ncbi:MAG TPA: DUF4403 family protein, partial [Chitinophagaceae bacterium]|nr:DUF4403 family protein [Chitinophagaceae bacterium]
KENLIIKIEFSGSHSGIAYFTGMPAYNEKERVIEIQHLDFDIWTKNILLKNAEWMFNRRIINEISRRSRFDLSAYMDTAMTLINSRLNHEWISGVKNTGVIHELKIAGFFPLLQHLVIRSNAIGNMEIKMNLPDPGF